MNTEDTFISHLVELRDRLLRAILAVLIVFLCLFPWAKDLYSLLAQPLLAVLPNNGQMIATDVVGVFLVPMKVALLVARILDRARHFVEQCGRVEILGEVDHAARLVFLQKFLRGGAELGAGHAHDEHLR